MSYKRKVKIQLKIKRKLKIKIRTKNKKSVTPIFSLQLQFQRKTQIIIIPWTVDGGTVMGIVPGIIPVFDGSKVEPPVIKPIGGELGIGICNSAVG